MWHTQATLSQHETSVGIANGGAGGKVALRSSKRYDLYKLIYLVPDPSARISTNGSQARYGLVRATVPSLTTVDDFGTNLTKFVISWVLDALRGSRSTIIGDW